MSDIRRRLQRAESTLNLANERIVVIIRQHGEEFSLPGTVKEWLTYPEAVAKAPDQNGIIVLSELKEMAARRARPSQ